MYIMSTHNVPDSMVTFEVLYNVQPRVGAQLVAIKNHILIPTKCFMY